MATVNKINNPQFTWGDSVQVLDSYLKNDLSKVDGSVCGISEIKNKIMQNKYNQPIGTFVYTIEFNDGASTVIPECYLRSA